MEQSHISHSIPGTISSDGAVCNAPAASEGHILVVDDDVANADMITRRLRHHGFAVTIADGGAAALEMVDRTVFDLILLDKSMPDVDGMEVLRRLRATSRFHDLPVVVATAEAASQSVVEALQAGANDYITKPVDFPVALARIRSQLSRYRAVNQLKETRDRYALAAAGSREVIWDWNPNSGELYLSDHWAELVGRSGASQTWRLAEWLDRVHPGDLLALRDAISSQCTCPEQPFVNEHRLLHANGSWRWVRVRGAAARDEAGQLVRVAGSMADITSSKVADSLTGLPNRAHFLERLGQAIDQARRQGTTLAVLFLDLDRFKNVNDSMGHAAGDQLLIDVADRLRACLRYGDLVVRNPDRISVARFGGDEFVLLVDTLRGPEDAASIAQRIIEAFAAPFLIEGNVTYASVSIGIACWNEYYRTPYELLRDADTAMYRAKSSGKNRYELFEASLRAQAVHRLRFENELRKAVDAQEFSVVWQPIVSLDTRMPVAVEALLRWPGFHMGECSLEEVIQVAEETGLILELGRWVLERACTEMKRLQASKAGLDKFVVNVNVSAKQLLSPNFCETVLDVLKTTGLPPSCLKLEVTESTMMSNASLALDVLQRLKCLSVKLGIDDFGTGFSSLSYLHQFPFDTLKLDRSFLHRASPKGRNIEIVRAMIHLAHALGMDVVAEGIETEDQAIILRDLGCEFGQGYFFARPAPTPQLESYLEACDCLPSNR